MLNSAPRAEISMLRRLIFASLMTCTVLGVSAVGQQSSTAAPVTPPPMSAAQQDALAKMSAMYGLGRNTPECRFGEADVRAIASSRRSLLAKSQFGSAVMSSMRS